MTDIAGDWAGKMLGTNNADIFVEIVQSQQNLTGTVSVNDPKYGSAVYKYKGILQGHLLNLEIDPPHIVNGVVQTKGDSLDRGLVTGTLVDTKRIEGKWKFSIGTAGTFWIRRADSLIETTLKCELLLTTNVAFVMMSISADDPNLEDSLNAIKRATTRHGIEAIRVDEIEHSKKITDVILEKLRVSRFLVCDISTERPNVYYELGFAHGIGKEVILVAREGTTLHFDIKDYNVIFYKSYSELEDRVAKRIGEAIVAQPSGQSGIVR
ncbi:MAG: hypothetical protein HW390_3112 [Candidatus Brocadiaceae bacterium]|nr:hypothetical protein [Candidatus Brocadiaceae bacterium]